MLRLARSASRSVPQYRAFTRSFASRVQVLESESDYSSLIAKPNTKSVVYFTAPWSGPCNLISPVFTELSNSFPDVTFAQVDVHELDDTAADAGVRAMPTFHFYADGQLQEPLELSSVDIELLKSNIEKLASM